jgi:hypothetical protein
MPAYFSSHRRQSTRSLFPIARAVGNPTVGGRLTPQDLARSDRERGRKMDRPPIAAAVTIRLIVTGDPSTPSA